jgi:hypothetical protein
MEKDEDDAGAMMARVPRADIIEKLSRYERSLEKSLYNVKRQFMDTIF